MSLPPAFKPSTVGVDTSANSATSTVKNTTIGVDPTVASEDELNFMKNSIRASAKVNSIPPDRVQALNVKLTEKELGHMAGVENLQIPAPTTSTTERVTKIERLEENTFRVTTVRTPAAPVDDIVMPEFRVLLASVLGTIDASIPNKDQNKAVKHLIRKHFDDAYYDVLKRFYPDANWATDCEYAVDPEPSRSKAFAHGNLKKA
jgi:hypothetical protein